MGAAVLRGISAGLLVTVLTLLGGMLWTAMGIGGVSAATIVDIGIFLSCMVGGYRTGKESRVWVLGGVTGAAYVAVGALLLALFLPLRAAGVLQVVLEGGVLGLIAGAIGAGGRSQPGSRGARWPQGFRGFSSRTGPYYMEEDEERWDRRGHWERSGYSEDLEPSDTSQHDSFQKEQQWDDQEKIERPIEPTEQKDSFKVQEWVPEKESTAWDERKVVGYARSAPWWEEEVRKG